MHLIDLLQVRTAGDPEDDTILFTDLTPSALAEKLARFEEKVCGQTIRRWLDEQGIRLRKIGKVIPGGCSPDRDAQFEKIAEWIEQYQNEGNPYFSVDTKAKEHLGQLYRAGRIRCSEAFRAYDHDFPSWAEGVVIPHGIYDPQRNRGHLNLGLSADTSLFACDSLLWYWKRIGQLCYPNATSILLLCDCGGSNAVNKYIFKHDLQQLAETIGIEIRVAHYPSYCSKYNLIERRFFPHVSRACQGMLFDCMERVVELMRKATTTTGLKTTVNVLRRHYQTGRNATPEMKRNLKIAYDDILPKWNYRATPQMRQ